MDRAGRLPVPTGDAWEDARNELRWAMSGRGLTPDRLAAMRAVLALPAVRAATAAVPDERRLVAAYDAVAAAARGLGDGIHARILRTSLAIDYAGSAKDLTSRRDELVRAHNDAVRAEGRSDYLAETPRSIFDVENKMLAALLTVLGAPPPGTPAPAPATASPAPWVWALSLVDVTFRLSKRSAREAEATYVVRALEDGASTYDITYYCTRETGPPSRLVLHEGGRVVDDREGGRRNFRIATVGFPPVRKGGERRLRFDVRYPGGSDAEPWLVIQVVKPTDRIVLRVTFDVPEVPARVWRIDGVLPEARAGDPDTSEPLVPDEFGCVESSWEAPPASYVYGIGWEW